MSTSSTPPGVYRIDVGDQVGRAYRAVFDNVQLVGEMALLPWLIVLGAEVIALLLPGTGMFGRPLASLVEGLAFFIFGSVFVVRWHRFILLSETASGGFVPPGWPPFIIAGLKLGAMVLVGWTVLVIVAILPPHVLTLPLTAVGGVALTLFAMRLSLIFPAAAVERPVGLFTAWDWISGNYWRMFVCLVACYLPFVVVEYIVNAIAFSLPTILWIVFTALRLAISFAAFAVAAALLSHLYRELVGEVAPPG